MEIYRPEKQKCELIQISDLWNHVYVLVSIHSYCFRVRWIITVLDIWLTQKAFDLKVKIMTPGSWENREW